MYRAYIRAIIEFLPEESEYFKLNGIGQDRPSRLALALNDPKFGWNFVRTLKDDGLEFPTDIIHPQLVQANAYLSGADDEAMDEALAISHPINTTKRNLLKALLISRDVTLANIANWMKLPLQVVRIYDQLFFSVRDRLDEPGYIVQLLNPDGFRLDRDTDSGDLLLLRAGATYGAQEVVRLAGLRSNSTIQSKEELLSDFERETVSKANIYVRHGGNEDLGSPVVASARSLAIAAKRNQRDEPPHNTLADALKDISKYNPVMDTLRQMTKPSVERMIQAGMDDSGQKPTKPDPNWAQY